jgi:hypothetical protein
MPYTTVITFVAYDPLAAADLNTNFSNLDYLHNMVNSQITLLAAGMKPLTGAAAAPGEVQMAGNGNDLYTMDFADGASDTAVEITFPMPSDYGGGTITAKYYWTANSTSTNAVVWGIKAVCVADDDTLDVAKGTAIYVTDANKSTAYDLNVSDASSAITIAGTPAAGELVNIRIWREPGNASDTLAVTARLIAVVLTYTRS